MELDIIHKPSEVYFILYIPLHQPCIECYFGPSDLSFIPAQVSIPTKCMKLSSEAVTCSDREEAVTPSLKPTEGRDSSSTSREVSPAVDSSLAFRASLLACHLSQISVVVMWTRMLHLVTFLSAVFISWQPLNVLLMPQLKTNTLWLW